jgi:intracellular sulfur oxidation DsrE/DsrF family protein
MKDLVRLGHLSAAVLLFLTLGLPATADAAGVVYHIDDSSRATGALRNVTNHRKAYPDLPITVVALAHGVEFLVDGAKDQRGNSYSAMVETLVMAGVGFIACENTMNALDISADELSLGVESVPSGVAEIGRLQLEEDYAYIKP